MQKVRIAQELIDYLKEEIIEIPVFCEAFAGTGALSKCLPETKLFLNEIEPCALAVLEGTFCSEPKNFERKIEELNSLTSSTDSLESPGIITRHYTPFGERKFFTEENGIRIDAVRQALNEKRYKHPFYLASLLKAVDRCANVSAVFGAFLKTFKKSALAPLKLQAHPIYQNEIQLYQMEAEEFVKECPIDSVLYLDPPYNTRQYGANYFLPSLIAEYPDEIEPRGITGLVDYYKSPFCQKRCAKNVLKNVIENSQSNVVCLSYNNEGILTLEELKNMFESFDSLKIHEIDFQRFRSNQRQENHRVIEYFLIAQR